MEGGILIPQWFLIIQGILTPALTLICSAALGVLWRMRQELTTLNVKVELTAEHKSQIEQLWKLVRELEKEVDRQKHRSDPDIQRHQHQRQGPRRT